MKKLKQSYPWTDKSADKIARAVIQLQSRFAMILNKQFGLVSPGCLKSCLIFFCIGWGGLSIYFIGAAALRNEKSHPVYKVDAIKRPRLIEPALDEMPVPMVDEHTYQQIQIFKRSGEYDSTIRARPGLADSILWLENIYQLQCK